MKDFKALQDDYENNFNLVPKDWKAKAGGVYLEDIDIDRLARVIAILHKEKYPEQYDPIIRRLS